MNTQIAKLILLIAMGYMLASLGAQAQVTGTYLNIGPGHSITASYASAVGQSNSSHGIGSIALGNFVSALANSSFAANYLTVASGDASVAFGNNTKARALVDFAIGQFNVGAVSSANSGEHVWFAGNSTTPPDPVFEIGNGASAAAPSNAFTVYKNGDVQSSGNVQVSGKVQAHGGMRCTAGGDLSMGSYTSGTAP